MYNFDDLPTTPWGNRVEFSKERPVAWRPNQIVALTKEARQATEAYLASRELNPRSTPIFAEVGDGEATLIDTKRDFDVDQVSSDLLLEGHAVQPNFVYFAHCASGCGCDLGLGANPFTGNPFTGNRYAGNPMVPNPFTGNPTAPQRSSASPAEEPPPFAGRVSSGDARAIVLDTGLADAGFWPQVLDSNVIPFGAKPHDAPDAKQDGFLDPVAGHGTFIAGVIDHRAPEHEIHVARVLSAFGDGDAATIARRMAELRRQRLIDENTVVNLSFGAYGDPRMALVASAVAQLQRDGAVVVASAGNDGTCMPSYPAAFPQVVSVGSIEPSGPAPYTNFGNWVVACAPGTNVVSSFFNNFNGAEPASRGADPDEFNGFADWTGTSFAAPIVAAAIMRRMSDKGLDAKSAASDLLADQVSLRYPGLGLVVDLDPTIAT